MKKKFWIGILTAVLLLNLLPGMTPSAAAVDDTSSTVIKTWCYGCKAFKKFRVTGFIPTPISSTPDPEVHWATIKCMTCGNEQQCSGSPTDDGGIFKHTGGTETPTCTTGKTCELCGAQYGILGHIWSDWQSNGDNTHTRTCQRDGCGAVETGNCNSSTAHCGTYGTCAVCGGTYFHADHTFPARWDWRSDTDVGRDAEYHWVRCLYCTEGKTAKSTHWFSEGNMHLKSPATCVSKPVYYKNCGTCYYKGTETYVYEWGNFDPNNHTGNEEIRGAAEATCTQDGYTGDTYCKDCDALLSSGTVIPAAGHTGGTATCKDSAVCEVCHKPYGEKDAANHVGGTEVRGAAEAACTQDGYTGDTYCKGCDALLSSGTAIPAAGEHTGGTPTCLRRAKCEVCGERYGDIDRSNHVDGCVPEWTVTETEHTQKYSRCGKLLTETGAHTFGDWTVTQEPTESEKGEQERVCTLCGCTETEAIPAAEVEASPSPAPTATPGPTAKPAAEPTEPASTGSVWRILLPVGLAGVAVGIGAGIAFRRRKKK